MSNKTEFILTARDETTAAFRSATANLGALKTSANSLMSSGITGMAGGLAAALLGAGFASEIQNAIDKLDKMDEAAERIGLTTESLSALAFAGKMTGLELEDMTGALTKLSVKIQEAASGDKSAAALFKDVGINVNDASGKIKSADSVFAELADRFSELEDGTAKTALAVDFFSKSGAKLVPTLNQGAAGLEAMRKEAEALGGIYDGKITKQAAEFNDNMDRLAVLSGSVGKSLAGELLPVLNKLAEEFLAGTVAAGGFFAALNAAGTLNPFKNTSENLKQVRADLAQIEADQAQYGYVDEERLKRKRNQLEYLKRLQINEALAGTEGNYSNEGRNLLAKKTIVRTNVGGGSDGPKKGGKKGGASADIKDYEAILTERVVNAIGNLDTVKAAELVATLRRLDEMAAAGLDPTIVQAIRDDLTGATKAAADETSRLNKLLSETDAEKLKEAERDINTLLAAREAGKISEAQFADASVKRFGELTEKVKEQTDLVKELGLTFTSAFEEAVVGGRKASEIFKALAMDLAKLALRKTVTEPLLQAAGGVNWGGLFGGSSATGSAVQLADGGVFNSPSLSAYSGGVYSSPRMFAFANGAGVFGEAGPEAIMPLSRGSDGKLGVKSQGSGSVVNIIVNNQAASQGFEATATAKKNGAGFDIAVLVAKAVTDDQRRNGPMTQGFQNTFGLSRNT